VTDTFYLPEGDGFVATLLTQGAWHPNQQHGGLVQALLARCAERVPSLVPMHISRMTVDMVRPVPIGQRLDVASRVVREGKRIQLVELVLTVDGVEHVRCTALRLRTDDLTGRTNLPDSTAGPGADLVPAPDAVAPMRHTNKAVSLPGFLGGVEMRRFPKPGAPEGVFGYWVRLKVPLLPYEPTSPLARLTVTADMTNAIGVMIDPTVFTTINPDLSLQVLRPPRGDWVSVAGDSRFQLDAGIGVSNSLLSDEEGAVAVASTSQLVQLR
jgi:hypothetical protein